MLPIAKIVQVLVLIAVFLVLVLYARANFRMHKDKIYDSPDGIPTKAKAWIFSVASIGLAAALVASCFR